MEDAEMRRFVEQQKRKKAEEERDKRAMLEQLARDKEERFGKKFDLTGNDKQKYTPFENVKYYTESLIKLYPTFRCGDQSKNCLNLIKVAINNIIKSPDEEKFRKIKMTNPTVQERLGKLPLALKILKSLSFEESGEFYEISNEKLDLQLLKDTSDFLENEISKLSSN